MPLISTNVVGLREEERGDKVIVSFVTRNSPTSSNSLSLAFLTATDVLETIAPVKSDTENFNKSSHENKVFFW